MYVVIAGAGQIGERLADSLLRGGHEIFVLDVDPVRIERLRGRLGSVAKVGDATSQAVLADAGVARASVFIATLGSDEDNLAACQLAKWYFNAQRTVAVVNDPDNVQLFEILGLDDAVSGTDLILSRIAGALPAHPLIRFMPVTGRSKELVGIKIPPAGVVAGKPLNEVNLPYGCQISLIIGPNGQTELPTQETVLSPQDEIIAVSPVESTDSLWHTLTELK